MLVWLPIGAVYEAKPEGSFFCLKRVRVLLFSARVRPVYFGGGYFHHRNASSKIAVIWVRFQHLVLRLLS